METLKITPSISNGSGGKVPYRQRTLKLCPEVEIKGFGSSHEVLFGINQWMNYVDTKAERLINKVYFILMCIEDGEYATRWQQLRLWWTMRRYINLQERWADLRLQNISLINKALQEKDNLYEL